MHRTIEPAILYLGAPVVLVSSQNPDGSTTGECVLNLASDAQVAQVDALALLTGSADVPRHKRALGYRAVRDKLGAAGLRSLRSSCVRLVYAPSSNAG